MNPTGVDRVLSCDKQHIDPSDGSFAFLVDQSEITTDALDTPLLEVFDLGYSGYLITVPMMWDEGLYPFSLSTVLDKAHASSCEYLWIQPYGTKFSELPVY